MTTEEKVDAIIIDHLALEAGTVLDPAAKMTDLDVDSLDIVELTMAFEGEWSIDIPDETINCDSTIADAHRAVTDIVGMRAA